MGTMTLELHYPPNWSYEGEVDVLYVDTNTRGETSYGRLAQGGTMLRETYEGHIWVMREAVSRELIMSVVAQKPAAGTGPQLVTVGSDGGLDPLRAALWRMGRAPREPLLKACGVLLKLLQNVAREPDEPKFRSLRVGNATIATTLDVPGVLAMLTCAGFEQAAGEGGEARLSLPTGRSLQPLNDAVAQLRRLDALLRGLPPPSESLSSMQQTAAAATAAAASAASSSRHAPSHRCAACGEGIRNDLRRELAGSGEIGGWRTHDAVGAGEYRFHCERCNVDLCSKCYDRHRAGEAGLHPLEHTLTITPPITTPWGHSGYGVPPAPPPVTSRNRRGPFG